MSLIFRFSTLQVILCLTVGYLNVALIEASKRSWIEIIVLGTLDCALLWSLVPHRFSTPSNEPSYLSKVKVLPEKTLLLGSTVRVDELAEALKVPWFTIVRELMELNIFARADSALTIDIGAVIAEKHGWKVQQAQDEA